MTTTSGPLLTPVRIWIARQTTTPANSLKLILSCQRIALCDSRHEYEHLTERVDDLEIENDRLRRQLAATNQRIDEHQELVEYVEEERRDRQRDRERRNAPVWRRAKWWVLGAPDDGGEGSEQRE